MDRASVVSHVAAHVPQNAHLRWLEAIQRYAVYAALTPNTIAVAWRPQRQRNGQDWILASGRWRVAGQTYRTGHDRAVCLAWTPSVQRGSGYATEWRNTRYDFAPNERSGAYRLLLDAAALEKVPSSKLADETGFER